MYMCLATSMHENVLTCTRVPGTHAISELDYMRSIYLFLLCNVPSSMENTDASTVVEKTATVGKLHFLSWASQEAWDVSPYPRDSFQVVPRMSQLLQDICQDAEAVCDMRNPKTGLKKFVTSSRGSLSQEI